MPQSWPAAMRPPVLRSSGTGKVRAATASKVMGIRGRTAAPSRAYAAHRAPKRPGRRAATRPAPATAATPKVTRTAPR